MKRLFQLFLILLATGTFFSCTDLDILPKTILQPKDIFNEAGIEAYMVNMYRRLPMDDFNVTDNNNEGPNGYYGWYSGNPVESTTGELAEGFKYGNEMPEYWTEGFKIIREANTLIYELSIPQNSAGIPKAQIDSWIAETKWVRAYVYFQIARRYGGVPLLSEAQAFSQNAEDLAIARSSCEETYNFILEDLDAAIDGLGTNIVKGRANRYVAQAFKVRVALTAAAIAKYGKRWDFMSRVDPTKMLCGIEQSKANDYYRAAWEVAYDLMASNRFSLAGTGATTPEAKEVAFASIWEDAENNSESILIRQYGALTGTHVHSFDHIFGFPRMASGNISRYSTTLDWLELFDGGALGERADGRLNTTYIGEDGKEYFRVFNSSSEIYEGLEPRLLASIMVPGRQYPNGFMVDYRVGVIKEEWDPATPIEVGVNSESSQEGDRSLSVIDNWRNSSKWDQNDSRGWWFWGNGDGTRLNNQVNPTNSDPYAITYVGGEQGPAQLIAQNYIRPSDGLSFHKWGLEGPARPKGGSAVSLTGVFGRKWVDVDNAVVPMDKSTTSWVDMRLAEVILGRAEAALELYQGGNMADNSSIPAVSSLTYKESAFDLQQDAFEQINAIRSRAGAKLLESKQELSLDAPYNRPPRGEGITNPNPGKGSFMIAPNRGIQILRVERLKEFFMERKPYWDYRRWFILREISEGGYYRRGLYPLLFAKEATETRDAVIGREPRQIMDGKYIYIRCMATQWGDANIQYPDTSIAYYANMPDMATNSLMEGNARQ